MVQEVLTELFTGIGGYISGVYDMVGNLFGGSDIALLVLKMIFFMILLAVAALFIWKFYNSLSEKDLLTLNLSQYNKSSHPLFGKVTATLLNLLEYAIIAPILIFLWSAALSIILLFISKQRDINQILMISVAMVGAVRILAYYKKEVAIDLSKLFPFVVLTIFLLEPGALSVQETIMRVGEIPLLFNSLFLFLLVVFVVELFLRVLYSIFTFWSSEEEEEEQRGRK